MRNLFLRISFLAITFLLVGNISLAQIAPKTETENEAATLPKDVKEEAPKSETNLVSTLEQLNKSVQELKGAVEVLNGRLKNGETDHADTNKSVSTSKINKKTDVPSPEAAPILDADKPIAEDKPTPEELKALRAQVEANREKKAAEADSPKLALTDNADVESELEFLRRFFKEQESSKRNSNDSRSVLASVTAELKALRDKQSAEIVNVKSFQKAYDESKQKLLESDLLDEALKGVLQDKITREKAAQIDLNEAITKLSALQNQEGLSEDEETLIKHLISEIKSLLLIEKNLETANSRLKETVSSVEKLDSARKAISNLVASKDDPGSIKPTDDAATKKADELDGVNQQVIELYNSNKNTFQKYSLNNLNAIAPLVKIYSEFITNTNDQSSSQAILDAEKKLQAEREQILKIIERPSSVSRTRPDGIEVNGNIAGIEAGQAYRTLFKTIDLELNKVIASNDIPQIRRAFDRVRKGLLNIKTLEDRRGFTPGNKSSTQNRAANSENELPAYNGYKHLRRDLKYRRKQLHYRRKLSNLPR